ncbi:MAG: hypothetical protein BGN88_04330 [Clostridiales bacterium 43-6]|nr:MAG: hypothetical protein BGN88_04330 [Clostridiales bacterium 43-6]
MLILYIIAGLFVLTNLLLYLPVHIVIEYQNELKITAKYLFLKYSIVPQKENKKSKKKDKQDETPKEQKEINEFTKQKEKIHQVFELIKSVRDRLNSVKNHLRIKPLRLKLGINGTDAADTAIKYGEVCALVYPVLTYLASNIETKQYDVNIYADYHGTKTTLEIYAILRFLPLYLLTTFFRTILDYIKRTKNTN